MTSSLSRREWLKAAATTAIAAPLLMTTTKLYGDQAPSNQIRVGFIGTGNQGMHLLTRTLRWNFAQVVAVCDVNTGSYGYREESHFYGREPAKKVVEEHYKTLGKNYPCRAYKDFREVLAQPDIDAVFIVVPDHWHAIMAVLASRAGKHIYCEKPLSLTVADGQEIVNAAKKTDLVFQTGSHERSNPISRFVCEKVKAGAIGKVTKVHTSVGYNNKVSPPPGWQPMPVPEGFNYDSWLGPAPQAPYHQDRCLYRFRFIYDYSGGQITNYGAHSNDMAHWGCGLDLTGPTQIECLAAKFPEPGSLFDTALETNFRCLYENGLELSCISDSSNVQTRFEGTDGWMQTGYRGTTASRKELLTGLPVLDRKKEKDPHSLHVENFIESIKGKAQVHAPVEVGNNSSTLCHLANVVIRRFPTHGRQLLNWDQKATRFTNDESANEMLHRPRREAWEKLLS
jgi:predicted dehydrogenase